MTQYLEPCKLCNTPYDQDEKNDCPACEGDAGVCEICDTVFDWNKAGDNCNVCSQIICDAHADYVMMREIHETTGDEATEPVCTECGDKIRGLVGEEKIKAMKEAVS